MRMMPMANNITTEQPRIEVKQRLTENPETKSFKSEYDEQTKKQAVARTEKSEQAESQRKVADKEEPNVEDSKIDDSKKHEDKSDKANTEEINTKECDTHINKDVTVEEIDTDIIDQNSSAELPEDATEERSENIINTVNVKGLDNNVKQADKKEKSEKLLKTTDQDELNQSIAAQVLIDPEKNSEIKLEIKTESDPELSIDAIDVEAGDLVEKLGGSEIDDSTDKMPNITQFSELKDKVTKKTTDKKSDNKISVNDIRSNVKDVVENEEVVVNSKVDANQSEFGEHSEASADKIITLGSTELSVEGGGGKAQPPIMKEFSSLLKQQLKDFGNNEIVKQSRFILKDNNVGEIKLILKPESLGQVKINLNLNENSLAGQIVVENNSVKEIFQENMNQLSKALEAEGFDSAKLELSSNNQEGSSRQDQSENKQYFSDRLKRIDESGQVVRYGTASAGIDLTA